MIGIKLSLLELKKQKEPSQQNPWGYVDLPWLAHFDCPSQRESRETMTQEGVRLEFSILISWRGEAPVAPLSQCGGIQNLYGKRNSSAQKRLQVSCPIWLWFIKVLTVSCPNQFQLKVSLTQGPNWKEKTVNRRRPYPCPPLGAFFWPTFSFPRLLLFHYQTPACILLWWWITEDKTKKSDVRPGHTCATCLSSSLPAPYLGHFVHRDWNSIDSERRQLWVNLLWRRGVLCQGGLQVFQDHALVLTHLQGIKGRSKQDAQQPGRIGAKQPESG